ncbi:hypothetical protein [Salipiger mucosus]|uniref:Uncharacterized protein n=1 Tax=Salipiger mucosus DSM 16094 TaxID=1123237 RepID=S9RS46_9RHOB|nr:hypothetical protein [Salipiger mucosus]EPX76799.1 hypothetical protein Salmuc_04685 [Salipiger mucosus DSM 16094]
MPYYLIRHRYSGETFRAEYRSKSALRRTLPRFCEDSQEYCSFWDIDEVSFEEFRKHKDARSAGELFNLKTFMPKSARA